jgi:hypothetical protein
MPDRQDGEGVLAALLDDSDGPMEIPLDPRRLERLLLTTPVHEIPSDYADRFDEIREAWRAGQLPTEDGRPLPDEVELAQWLIRDTLASYARPQSPARDQLYVLDFQSSGGRNYVMFGHTTRLAQRLVDHVRDATPHGYALFAGWASPAVVNAQPLEQAALNVSGFFAGRPHYRERFYGMRFEVGQRVARAVFEYNTGWRATGDQQASRVGRRQHVLVSRFGRRSG